MSEETTVINKIAEPNSYETGSAGDRHKIYYDQPADLARKLKELREMGLIQ